MREEDERTIVFCFVVIVVGVERSPLCSSLNTQLAPATVPVPAPVPVLVLVPVALPFAECCTQQTKKLNHSISSLMQTTNKRVSKKKEAKKFTIDCSAPAGEGVFDTAAFVS